jgi:hypothetical protein
MSFIYLNVLVNLLMLFFERGGQIEGKQEMSCPSHLPNLYNILCCWSTLALSGSYVYSIYHIVYMKSKLKFMNFLKRLFITYFNQMHI